jgi:hypothetical protein
MRQFQAVHHCFMGQEEEFSEAVFLLVASLVDSRDSLRNATAVAGELAYWLNFILSLRMNTQSKSPVIGLILTHKDMLPLPKQSVEEIRSYHKDVLSKLQQLVPIIVTEDVQMWSINARDVSEACSMLEWLADQHARLVARLQPVPRLTLKAGEVIREMRTRGGERCMRYAYRVACVVYVPTRVHAAWGCFSA